jgi:hypothetical protein
MDMRLLRRLVRRPPLPQLQRGDGVNRVRCLECHGLQPDKDECVECMATGLGLDDDSWEREHTRWLNLVQQHLEMQEANR